MFILPTRLNNGSSGPFGRRFFTLHHIPKVALMGLAGLIAGCATNPGTLKAGRAIPAGHFTQHAGLIGYDVPARFLSGEAPVYPITRLLNGESGTAEVEYTIDENGVPQDVRVLNATYKYFGAHAVIAVRKWRFSPAMKDGKPVAVRVTQIFSFKTN